MVIGMSIHRDIVSLMLNDFEGQRPEGSSAYELLRLGKPPAPPTAVLGFDLLDVAPDIDHTWNCYRRFYEMIPPLSITKVSNDLLDPEADVQAVLDFIQAHEDDDSPNRFWTP